MHVSGITETPSTFLLDSIRSRSQGMLLVLITVLRSWTCQTTFLPVSLGLITYSYCTSPPGLPSNSASISSAQTMADEALFK
jgi:hypothetical protein